MPWVAVNHPAEGDEEAAAAAPGQKPRPRAKKKTTEPATQDGEDAAAPPKKARKPRKPKVALSSEVVEGLENEVGRIADEIVAAAVKRKPKPRRR